MNKNITTVQRVAAKAFRVFDLKIAMLSLVAAVVTAMPLIGGTQADFTAIATNPGNAFSSAVLSMTTDNPVGGFVQVENLVPGDSITRSVTVQNTGSVPFTYTITASSEGASQSALWKNKVYGLQVYVSGANGLIFSGPIKDLAGISTGAVVPASGTEVLLYVISLPQSSGNAFQGLNQGIGFTYDAVQLAGQAR